MNQVFKWIDISKKNSVSFLLTKVIVNSVVIVEFVETIWLNKVCHRNFKNPVYKNCNQDFKDISLKKMCFKVYLFTR